MEATKLSDDVAKVIAGAILVFGYLLGAIIAFLAVADLSLTRKILLVLILLLTLFLLELADWRSRKAGDKRKTTWSLLLDLMILLRKELDPEKKNLFRRDLLIRMTRWSLIGLIVVIVLAALFGIVEDTLALVVDPPTPTPTPTQTLTLTPSPTITLTPSPRPLSDSLYYMIVYDSSRNMDESFHGQKKWQVAKNLLIEIMNGLNLRAQYSMVTIGGPNSPDSADPCTNPGSLALPFSPRQAAYGYLVDLQPQGVGSFYRAYTLAKNQLEDLPRDTIRTLIYITGSEDTCETEDEWTAIKNLATLPDSTFGIFSQIIVLDEDGIRSQSLADRFNSLSNSNINAKAPQSLSEIQGNGVTLIQIVNNVNVYVEREIATREPEVVKSPTPFVLPTNTLTSGEIPTVSPPTRTSPPPTAVPPTSIPPTPIPSTSTPQLPDVLNITAPSNGASLSCARSEDCTITVTVQWISDSQASAQGLYLSVWVKPYPGDTGYLFSSQTEVSYLGNGLWQSSPVYIGQKDVDEQGTPFAIYAIITGQPYGANLHVSPLPSHTREFSIAVTR